MVKSVLITGASSGIGKAVAFAMLRRGWTVYATARKIEAIEELKFSGAHTFALDVTKQESIDAVFDALQKQNAPLDVIVNNAGFGLFGPIEDIPISAARGQFETNVFGLIAVTKTFLPMLRQSNNGRIVNISSIAGRVSMPMGGWYAASKFAVEALGSALRLELLSSGIKVISIQPGPIHTGFGDVAFDNLSHFTSNPVYLDMLKGMEQQKGRFGSKGVSVESVAYKVIKIIACKNPKAHYRVTALAKLINFIVWLFPTSIQDAISAKQFNVRKPKK